METMILEVQKRQTGASGNSLRGKKLIPAEYYGKGVKNHSLQIDYSTFRRLYRTAGKNTVLELNIDGKEKCNALVQDVQYHPVTDDIMHVDFINVRMDQVIHAKIPLKFVGIAPAVKELGGILTHSLNFIDVKCLPKDLISFIEVSVDSIIDFHSYVRIKDLNLPSSVTVLHQPNDVVITAVAPKAEEEETAPVAATAVEGAAATGTDTAAAAGAAPAAGAPASVDAGKEGKK